MLKGLIGKKIGMTQIFDEQGVAYPVTIIEAGPCYVTQAAGELGHLKAGGLSPLRFLREFRSKEAANVGDRLTVDMFAVGDHVDVMGTSKGKGFAGAVKRYHFQGGKKTHGQSDRHRAPGSNGSGTTPGRVLKNSRRAGHMGSDRVTIQALKVVLVDAERNLLGVHGAVPGGKGGLVVIKEARKQ